MPSLKIRKATVRRRKNNAPQPPIHAVHLWRRRGSAPNRNTMTHALFESIDFVDDVDEDSESDTHGFISFNGPSSSSSSSSSSSTMSRKERYVVFMDDEKRFYFFERRDIEHESRNIEGLYLLVHANDKPPVLHEDTMLCEITPSDIDSYAPALTQRAYIEKRMFEGQTYVDLRMRLGKWRKLYEANVENKDRVQIEFGVSKFTRSRRMTTGRIGGIWK